MYRKILLAALFLLASIANAATAVPVRVVSSPINFTMMASRTSGLAPLGVFFSTAGMSESGLYGFHDIQCTWGFGDSGAGTWSNGAQIGASKNAHVGPMAGHVYETPGNYTATVSCTDGTNTVQGSIVVTVSDPDAGGSPYTGTNTVCIAANSTPTPGSGGCPSGASAVNATSAYGSADFDQALGACKGQNKRCLFKGGDVFTASAQTNISNAGPMTVGSYPANSTKAEVDGTNITLLNLSSTAVTDLRIMDLKLVGLNGASDTGTGVAIAASVDQVTMLRLDVDTGTGGLTLSSGSNPSTWTICARCIVQDSSVISSLFMRAYQSAVLGSSFGPGYATAEHSARFQRSNYAVYANNTFNHPGSAAGQKHAPAIRADVSSQDTTYLHFADNKIVGGGTQTEIVKMSPSADTENARIFDVVNERNWYTAPSQDSALAVNLLVNHAGTRVSVRNNLLDMTNSTATVKNGIVFDPPSGVVYAPPSFVWIYNNTIFSNDGAVTSRGVWLGAEPTNAVVKNNLVYFPAAGGSGTPLLDQASGTVASNNTSNTATNPNFTTTPPVTTEDYKPTAGSYAIGGGTAVPVWSDFFGVAQPGTRDIGAVVH